TVPLGIEEKRAAFYQAVVGQVSELRVVNLFSKKMNGIDMSYEEIKNYVSQLEAEKKSDQAASTSRDSVPKVQMVRKSNVTQRGTESMKCYNCNQLGHMSSRCPFAEQGWSFCYYCNRMAQHKRPNCPKRTSDGVGNSR
ncbi:PREDICTED: uncharacterized protein LOC105455196, partial [Wasmannia auropunctata]|uniref:uncharacterized protein LOC105455196 n=1 Tax=Wasmannia auropunctata TaxID=64793 RepID=UPI0005EE67A6